MGSTEVIDTLTGRSFEDNLAFIVKDSEEEFLYHILIGFVPNMRVNSMMPCFLMTFYYIGTWSYFHESRICE
jgi:hypothetical protein